MEGMFSKALKKIVDVLSSKEISYMIVGGFAVSFYNRGRTTNDIDLILQIEPDQVKDILGAFPLWKGFEESFQEDIRKGMLFNLTDFDTGIRYDFMPFRNSEYAKTAFMRREEVEFLGTQCYVSSKEDLVISKLQWYNISPSEKQEEDIRFLSLDKELDTPYVNFWIDNLKIETHGFLG